MYVVVSKHTYSGLHTGFGAGGQVEIPKSWGGGGGGWRQCNMEMYI